MCKAVVYVGPGDDQRAKKVAFSTFVNTKMWLIEFRLSYLSVAKGSLFKYIGLQLKCDKFLYALALDKYLWPILVDNYTQSILLCAEDHMRLDFKSKAAECQHLAEFANLMEGERSSISVNSKRLRCQRLHTARI